jgi:hypothetical protein
VRSATLDQKNRNVIPNPPLARGLSAQFRGVGEESAFSFVFEFSAELNARNA